MRAGPLLLALLCGCAHYTTSSSMAPTQLGHAGVVPVRLAQGQATAVYFLDHGSLGNDSEEQAVRRARGWDIETSLADATVEHRVTCFPSCEHSLITWRTTVVTGSLVKPTGYKDVEAPQAPKPPISLREPTPSVETLCLRFEGLFRDDAVSAKEFYDSLDPSSRSVLRDYILSSKGIKSTYPQEFRIPRSAGQDEKKFLGWFLREYTDLMPVFE